MLTLQQLAGAPGADLVAAGLDDLRSGRESTASLLVGMAATRLRSVGIEVPTAVAVERPAHRLYDRLAADDPGTAHSRFNALALRLASFAHAAEHARTR